VLSSNCTWENKSRRLKVIDYKGHASWTSLITAGILHKTKDRCQNIFLCKQDHKALQMLYRLSPEYQVFFRKRVCEIINEAKWKSGENHQKIQWSEERWREVSCGEDVKVSMCSEVEWREGHGEMWVQQLTTLCISLLVLFSVQYTLISTLTVTALSVIFINCICIVFTVCSGSF
jgi:hypothetical protein